MATVFGRMFPSGEISGPAYNAASKFAVLRARVDRALGLPVRNPRSLLFEAARGLSLMQEDAEQVTAVVDAWDAAVAAIGVRSAERKAVESVVIYDQALGGYAEKLAFKAGLDALMTHWRLR